MITCETSNNKVSDHFPEFRKKVDKTTEYDIISVEKSKRYYMEKLTIKGFQDKSNIEIIEELMKKNNGYITSKELDMFNIHRMYLSIMQEKGIIEKVASGIYIDINKNKRSEEHTSELQSR